jgi:hypothetical protein
VTGGLFGFAATLPFLLLVVAGLVCAFILQGIFANLTAGLLAAAEPGPAGLTLHSFVGFGAVSWDRLPSGRRWMALAAPAGGLGNGLWHLRLASLAGAGAMLSLAKDSQP